MSKHINHTSHRKGIHDVYIKHLHDAASRGMLTQEDADFWAVVNKKTKISSSWTPFRYLYRQAYRMGIRRSQFTTKKA